MIDPVETLVERARAGDFAAASELLEQFSERIFAYFRRLAGNEEDGADLTEKTFCKVWASLQNYNGRASFNTWLHAIEQEVMALREQAKELPKLRNEVSRLRGTRVELDRARAENARLLDAKRTGALIPREAPSGFISKDRLTFAGFGTPEAAIETFFWAMREGNVDAVMESL